MGQMKDFLITVHNGGDEAVAAVQRVSEDWRAQLEQAADEIARLRLTDEEREAIHFMFRHAAQAADHDPFPDSADYIPHHKVISAMMERLA